jgi:prepilin-type N-terminal cleavage/methylation domain-containing protein
VTQKSDIHLEAGERRQWRRSGGFSLLEMLVAVTIMLIIMGAIFESLKGSFKVSMTSHEMSDVQQGVRAAHEYINRDLIVAGDGLNGINNIRLPTPFVVNYLTQSPVINISDPDHITLSIITSDDNVPAATFVPGAAAPMQVLAGSDRVTMLKADRSFTPISLDADAIDASGSTITISQADVELFSVGEIYFLTSGDRGAFGVITDINDANPASLSFGDGDAYGLNLTGGGGYISFVSDGGQQPTTLMRMNMAHYFVNAEGLFMKRLFGIPQAGFVDIVIAEHLVNLQFRYALNIRDANGNLPQPVDALETTVQQAATRQVEVAITTETAHAINNGAHQQLTMKATASIRNMQFRLAQR